jgi:glucose/arabinose dehydrogenase
MRFRLDRAVLVVLLLTALPVSAQDYRPNPADINVPPGYKIEVFASGLDTPMGVAFGDNEVYTVESGWLKTTPSVVVKVLSMDGKVQRELARGKLGDLALGVNYHDGKIWISRTASISLVDPKTGDVTTYLEKLPSMGDHNVSRVAFHGDHVYFGLGSYTNSGVVGTDVAGPDLAKTIDPATGELGRDVPCRDIRLSGANFKTPDGKETGAFRPFGTASRKGEVVKGQVPCSSSVIRARVNDAQNTMELVGWGFRNPFGLAFAPPWHPVLKGALLVSNNGMDTRGSRPVANSPDELFVMPSDLGEPSFHGWPDVSGFLHVGAKQSTTEVTGQLLGENVRGIQPVYDPLPRPVTHPVAVFPINSSADGMDFSTTERFGYQGDLFIALWGHLGFAPADRVYQDSNVVRVRFLQPAGVQIIPFVENRTAGAASLAKSGGLNHPVDVRFGPDGAMYITDFGVVDTQAFRTVPNTGVIWKVTRR